MVHKAAGEQNRETASEKKVPEIISNAHGHIPKTLADTHRRVLG